MKGQILMILAASILTPLSANAQFHEHQVERKAESEIVRSTKGGATLEIAASYDKTFDAVLRYLKLNGYDIDSANKEAGQIATAIEIAGGYHQTGKRVIVSIIKDSDTSTTIRVAVTVQKRFRAITTEPWNEPKVDEKASADIASKMQSEVAGSLADRQ